MSDKFLQAGLVTKRVENIKGVFTRIRLYGLFYILYIPVEKLRRAFHKCEPFISFE